MAAMLDLRVAAGTVLILLSFHCPNGKVWAPGLATEPTPITQAGIPRDSRIILRMALEIRLIDRTLHPNPLVPGFPEPIRLKSHSNSVSGIIVRIALGLTLTLAAEVVFAQEAALAPEKRARIEQAVAKFMAANQVPGISAAVVENGEFVWSEGFGMADLEQFVPATAQTLYRLASVSKQLTAVAAMRLSEQDKLDLDAPVQKYCPAFPVKEAPISTRLLLAHLAGVRHYKSNSNDDPEIGNVKHFDDPVAGGLQFFAKDPLVAKPGTKFNYTTHGYTVVGCAIEGATDEKYVDYVREHVFAPAGMTHSVVDDRYAIIPYRTRFYHKDKSGAVVNAEFLDSSYKIPGGGWLSSADDMARFEVAILNDKLIKRATRDAMWTPQKASDGSTTGYALGWGWGRGEKEGLHVIGHSGGQQGTSTYIMLEPERRDGVVILINMDEVDAGRLATEVMKVVVGISENAPRK
jgi:CubicO group peptidase (beta-lactamase class C family)